MLLLSRIRKVPREGEDWAEAERIKGTNRRLAREREPFWLSVADVNDIVTYKLRTQEGRTAKHRVGLSNPVVKIVTRAAFEVCLRDDPKTELVVRVGILSSLPGIGIGIASAILALVEPQRYAIIDWRGWRQAFGVDKRSFTPRDYHTYMVEVRRLAEELGWEPQVVDWCLWNLDQYP